MKFCKVAGPCSKGTKLCVDHCHSTGKVRGLLCHRCNRALGVFKDDIEFMRKAMKYLEEHSEA